MASTGRSSDFLTGAHSSNWYAARTATFLTPTNEDALVLYHPAGAAVTELVDRLQRAGTVEVPDDDPTLNPYWPRQGARCFVDPDGYRLILVQS